MYIIKRDGSEQPFDSTKVINVITDAANSVDITIPQEEILKVLTLIKECDTPTVETIQDIIEMFLMQHYPKAARAFIVYRERRAELRYVQERAQYIETYSNNQDNGAEASEVDANANVQNKNVATLEAELYKTTNMDISRYRVKTELKELYGEAAPDYEADLKSHIIYKHDESSAPATRPYCAAVNMYPFLQHGTASLDGLNTKAPNNLNSFCGQFNNLVFLLSSQFQGAVAFAEFFNVFTYYCIKEWGMDFYKRLDESVVFGVRGDKTIGDMIDQSFQNIVYTINQPAGNRSYQSPFTNVSYFDKFYWESMFGEHVFPDGSKLDYVPVNMIQQRFMKWFNAERKKCLLTFPVETVAMLHDGKDFLDKEWKEFTAEMYAEGHSFFTYISDNADSLSSCCRLRNAVKPEFSFTSGNVGVATGSKSVITINLNRLVQEFVNQGAAPSQFTSWGNDGCNAFVEVLKHWLSKIYKYHTAYNSLLEKLQANKMLPVYDKGYISLNQQFLTIGINGCNEAAMFLGIDVSDNNTYQNFCELVTKTISTENQINSTRSIRFNTEFVPAEGLGIKNYEWDKADGYWVPAGRNCYTSYFFLPDGEVELMEQMRLHGKRYTDTLDGSHTAC